MDSNVSTVVFDDARRRRHKLRNAAQSALLLGGMVALLTLCVWLVLGPGGVLWALLLWGTTLALGPQVSPRVILALYGARPIPPDSFPVGYEVLRVLSRRAGLERVPALYYIPSPVANAFTVGTRAAPVIAVTDGLLRSLHLRELAGVLAHEVSHIRNNDLWVMNLADGISRLTGILSSAGMVLLAITLPLTLADHGGVPWLLIALLVFAPTVGTLLQLALSRAREFDADLDAAALTGDPAGLASALEKLDRERPRFWDRFFLAGRRNPAPSHLRTHPPTEERIRRLLSLYAPAPALPFGRETLVLPTDIMRPVHAAPRWRFSGLWY